MNESEFRDWMRNQLRALDNRLKRVEARAEEMDKPKVKVSGELGAGMTAQAEALLKAVRAGGVTDMAIVYLGPDGPIDGWTSSGPEGHLMLLGALSSLGDSLLHPDKERLTEEAAA